MRFSEMRPEQYEEAKQVAPVAYIPWGAHEWHGRHNPLGLDSLKAEGMCLALCAETGGVVFPTVYCGTDTMKTGSGFGCTLEFSESCVQTLVREHLRQLADEGFLVIVILMGHYGGKHVEAIKAVVEDFNADQSRAIGWAFADHEATAADGFIGEHAALYETSYILALRPDLVDMDRLPKEGEIDSAVEGMHGEDPRGKASSEIGMAGLQSLVKNAAPEIRRLLQKMQNPAGTQDDGEGEPLVAVYEASDEMEAHIVRGLLAEAGVPVVIRKSISQVYPFPVNPFSDEAVSVPESHAEHARELIKQFLADGRELNQT